MKTSFVIDAHADGRDALGLLLASRKLDICAVTACYAEGADLDATPLQQLCRSLAISTEVADGSAVPLVYKRSSEDANPFPLAASRTMRPAHGYAWDMIYRQAKSHPEGISILAFGPLTNIAIAIFKYQDLAAMVKEIIIAGGSFSYGDVTPFAESHAYQDVYAWQAVAQSGIPVTMVGLNAAQSVTPTVTEVETLQPWNMEVEPMVAAAVSFADEVETLLPAGDWWTAPLKIWREKGLGLPLDLAAAAVAASPETATTEQFHVAIETVSTAMYGRTLVDWRFYNPDVKETKVVTAICKNKIRSLLIEK